MGPSNVHVTTGTNFKTTTSLVKVSILYFCINKDGSFKCTCNILRYDIVNNHASLKPGSFECWIHG